MEIFGWIIAGGVAMFLRQMVARYGRPGRGWMKWKEGKDRKRAKKY